MSKRQKMPNNPPSEPDLDAIVELRCPECGVKFGVTNYFLKKRQEDHNGFYCPNRHACSFPKPKEEVPLPESEYKKKYEKLLLENERLKAELELNLNI